MLTLPNKPRLFLFQEAVDMRRSFEGLSAIAEKAFPEELLTDGAYFIFLNRRKDSMKVLYWDLDGLAIWYKRLEKGTFSRKSSENAISRREFLMLLEGIEPKKFKLRYTMT